MKWTVRSSRQIIKDRWISLRADDCTTERGTAVNPYYVLDYPDFVHALVLDPADNVVLVRQYRHGWGSTSLELPGGMTDRADHDPIATALREVAEETGYAGGVARLLNVVSPDPSRFTNKLCLVGVEGATKSVEVALDSTESIEVVVLPIRRTVALALEGGFVHASHIGLLLMGLHHLRRDFQSAPCQGENL